MYDKKCFWLSLAGMIAGFIIIALFVMVIDPFFHYHAPLQKLQYPINNEIYMNNGILKHFEYDSVITGTSMAQNFKTSTFNDLFDASAVKTTFSGENYKRIGMNLRVAFDSNKDVKNVLWVLDWSRLSTNEDRHEEYPEYIYDSYILNDWNYLFNKDIVKKSFHILIYTLRGNKTTTFDEYSNWNSNYQFGKEAILKIYSRRERESNKGDLSNEKALLIKENLNQNVVEIIKQHPETNFYIVFPPYSIYYWDAINQSGLMDSELAAQRIAIEQLIPYNNIKLFSFNNNFELICNTENYKDYTHYSEDINDNILYWIKDGDFQLKSDNYMDYIESTEEFYRNFPYDTLF